MEDALLISLRIAGRNVSVNVPAAEKDLVERAAGMLNEKIEGLSGSSVDAEMRLLLSALSACGDYLRLQQQDSDRPPAATESPVSVVNIGGELMDEAELDRRLEALSAQLEAAVRGAETPPT